MKHLLIALPLFLFLSCNDVATDFDCNKVLSGNVGFMLHGGILNEYDNGRVFISIVRVNDPKNWDFNEYFTGEVFSKDESSELQVIEKDSCELKQRYFKYLKTRNIYFKYLKNPNK